MSTEFQKLTTCTNLKPTHSVCVDVAFGSCVAVCNSPVFMARILKRESQFFRSKKVLLKFIAMVTSPKIESFDVIPKSGCQQARLRIKIARTETGHPHHLEIRRFDERVHWVKFSVSSSVSSISFCILNPRKLLKMFSFLTLKIVLLLLIGGLARSLPAINRVANEATNEAANSAANEETNSATNLLASQAKWTSLAPPHSSEHSKPSEVQYLKYFNPYVQEDSRSPRKESASETAENDHLREYEKDHLNKYEFESNPISRPSEKSPLNQDLHGISEKSSLNRDLHGPSSKKSPLNHYMNRPSEKSPLNRDLNQASLIEKIILILWTLKEILKLRLMSLEEDSYFKRLHSMAGELNREDVCVPFILGLLAGLLFLIILKIFWCCLGRLCCRRSVNRIGRYKSRLINKRSPLDETHHLLVGHHDLSDQEV